MDVAETLAAYLVGRHLNQVKRRENDWTFTFRDASGSGLTASCPWRIIVGQSIAFTNSDDGKKFGFTEPVDGEELTQCLLGQKVIERISIRSDTGDLSITFAGNTVLEVLNMSSGFEAGKWVYAICRSLRPAVANWYIGVTAAFSCLSKNKGALDGGAFSCFSVPLAGATPATRYCE